MPLEDLMDEAEALGCYWTLGLESLTYARYRAVLFSFSKLERVAQEDRETREGAMTAAIAAARVRLAELEVPRHVILSTRDSLAKERLYCAKCNKSWKTLPKDVLAETCPGEADGPCVTTT